MPILGQVRREFRHWRLRNKPKCIILLYHRVADVSPDPQLLCVRPSNFRSQLEVIAKCAHPLSMAELAARLDKDDVPDRSVAITFDDGYEDNLKSAKPILAERKIPATVFVASGFLNREREFWWDELEKIFLEQGALPKRLDLQVNGDTHQWDLGEAAHYDEPSFARHKNWNALMNDAPTRRHAIYRELCPLVKELPMQARTRLLDDLREWSRVDPRPRGSHLALSPEGVVSLASGGLIEIGAHTVNHPMLSALSPVEQESEIKKSKADLESILGRPVASFAYPYGLPTDYQPGSVAMVRQAGFTRACSNFPGFVMPDVDRYQIPRLLVRDWDGKEFARRLGEFFYA